MAKASTEILKALAVCAELTQTEFTEAGVRAIAAELAAYPEQQILGALQRCRRELGRGQLTLSAILTRIDDGRPGPEEAWSMIPRNEAASCFWTDEMRAAYFVARPLLLEGDDVQARMAFLEHYRAGLQRARDAKHAVTWTFSPGTDKDGRELAILDAVEKGRISSASARALLPHHRTEEALNARLLSAAKQSVRALPAS